MNVCQEERMAELLIFVAVGVCGLFTAQGAVHKLKKKKNRTNEDKPIFCKNMNTKEIAV